MQRIAISGLAAVAAVLGGAAVPTVAMGQPMSRAVGADSTDPVTATDPSVDAVAVSCNGTTGTLQALTAPAPGDPDVFTRLAPGL